MPLFHVTPRDLGDGTFARVRDPATTQLLTAKGVTVEWSTYWQNRLQDEEIDRADPPVEVEPEEPDAGGEEKTPPPPAPTSRKAAPTKPAASAENKD